MPLAVIIENRKAIPVRALPFVTGWNLSPDEVAKAFARHKGGEWCFRKIYAYHSPANPTKFNPAEWDNIVIALDALSSRLNTLEQEGMTKAERRKLWRQDSLKELPEGVFAWLDEFEPVYQNYTDPETWIEPLREGEREVNLSAYCSADKFQIIMSGFEPYTEELLCKSEQSAAPTKQGAPEKATGCTTTHKLKRRSNILYASIEQAKRIAIAPDDYHSVWAALVSLAESKDRPAPLLGHIEGEGIKYQGSNSIQFFTKTALNKRMNPDSAR